MIEVEELSQAELNMLQHAGIIASEAKCVRRQIGAVIALEGRIIATGRNGTPRGIANCGEGGCPRAVSSTPSGIGLDICTGVHAEQNAIIMCAYFGTSPVNGTMYVYSATPCRNCAASIIQAGITRVVTNGVYPDSVALDLLSKAGVELVVYKPKESSPSREGPGEV